MLGSATFTTLASSTTMNWATATMESTALALAFGVASDASVDTFRRAETRRQELSGSVQRRACFVEDRVIRLEDVGHARGDVERDRDVRGGGLPREADGVVQEHLVTSSLDDQRRQPGQV